MGMHPPSCVLANSSRSFTMVVMVAALRATRVPICTVEEELALGSSRSNSPLTMIATFRSFRVGGSISDSGPP